MRYRDANRRYVTVTAIATTVLLIACLGLAWAESSAALPTYVLWMATAIPVAALLTPLWALWRYLNEIDEFLRSIQLNAILCGLAALLLVASTWGFVEIYIDAPQVSMFWLNPIFWVTYSIATVILSRREGIGSEEQG
jgi:hypothetical protein